MKAAMMGETPKLGSAVDTQPASAPFPDKLGLSLHFVSLNMFVSDYVSRRHIPATAKVLPSAARILSRVDLR